MKHKFILILIFLLIAFSLLLNYYIKNFKIRDNLLNMEMINSHTYIYDKDKLLVDYLSKNTNIEYNWNKFSSVNNNGNINFENKVYTFKSNKIELINRRNTLELEKFILNIDNQSKINLHTGIIDLRNKNLYSNDKIYYKNKNFLGLAEKCYADLNKKNIIFYKTVLEF